jgi:hypothetical protein
VDLVEQDQIDCKVIANCLIGLSHNWIEIKEEFEQTKEVIRICKSGLLVL